MGHADAEGALNTSIGVDEEEVALRVVREDDAEVAADVVPRTARFGAAEGSVAGMEGSGDGLAVIIRFWKSR